MDRHGAVCLGGDLLRAFCNLETLEHTAKFIKAARDLGGAKALKVDWRATWRNWVRRENDRGPSIVRPMARVLALSSAGQATATAMQGFVARGGRDHA
jgi:ribulose-5-phosphate 4-epimerase/fuculose-1-phosphate aldolase